MDLSASSACRNAGSFMLLTVHKGGSSYVGGIFKEIFARHGYDLFDPVTLAYGSGAPIGRFMGEHADRMTAPRSFFGPFRASENGLAAHIADARPIIHVRDPRDCLVSLYYSIRYSHVIPAGEHGAELSAWRENLALGTVNSFVENFMLMGKDQDWAFSRAFELFDSIRRVRSDAVISRYEDMVDEFPDWLVGIVEQLGIEIDYEVICDVIARADFLVNLRVEENVYNHKRQVMPGDFRRKLAPPTQARLTRFFEQELTWFGYA